MRSAKTFFWANISLYFAFVGQANNIEFVFPEKVADLCKSLLDELQMYRSNATLTLSQGARTIT